MPTKAAQKESEQVYDPRGVKFPFSLNLRIKYFLTGVIAPAICIGFALQGDTMVGVGESWQSGEFSTYVSLFLTGRQLAIFIPFFLFSMIGLSFLTFRSGFRKTYWVKAAIYTGVPLSTVYLVLLAWPTLWFSPFVAVFAGPLLTLVVWSISKLVQIWANQITITHLLIATAVVAVCISISMQFFTVYDWLAIPTMILGLTTVAGPTLNCVTYWRIAIAIFREDVARSGSNQGWSRSTLLGCLTAAIAWIVAYWLATRQAITWTLEEYAKLPTQPPDCYVCSAAANGHAHWVGSSEIKTSSGSVFINTQMQRLKVLELILMVICPGVHQPVRRIYNWAGPRLAHLCSLNPWPADVTYLLLKPIEWFAIAMAFVFGISASAVAAIYRPE